MPSLETLTPPEPVALEPSISRLNLPIGAFIADRYHVMHQFASNPYTEVYHAMDWGEDDEVGLKIFHEPDEMTRTRVTRELETHKLMGDKPGILLASDMDILSPDDQDRAYRYVATEFAPDGTLAAVVKDGPSGFDTIVRYIPSAIETVEEMHARGILHMDIKPSNLLLDGEKVKVADFGSAERDTARADSREKMAQLGSVAFATKLETRSGTLGLAAPEAMCPNKLIGVTADTYLLGGTILQLVTGGELPYGVHRDSQSYYDAAHTEAPIFASDYNPNLPKGFDSLIRECFARMPEDRPTPAELRQGLREL